MKLSRTTKEGRVNVALGNKEASLAQQADIAGTTKTNLARILILDALERLESGELRFQPATVESVQQDAANAREVPTPGLVLGASILWRP